MPPSDAEELRRKNAFATAPGEDRAGERRNEQNTGDKRANYDERLDSVNEVLILSNPLRERSQVLEHKSFENHQESERNDRDK